MGVGKLLSCIGDIMGSYRGRRDGSSTTGYKVFGVLCFLSQPLKKNAIQSRSFSFCMPRTFKFQNRRRTTRIILNSCLLRPSNFFSVYYLLSKSVLSYNEASFCQNCGFRDGNCRIGASFVG